MKIKKPLLSPLLKSAAAPGVNRIFINPVPSVVEVSRRAYFNYLYHGSRPGNDVQHWLEAETQLFAERGLARHGV